MPKVYQRGTEKGTTGEEPGEKKGVRVYDKPGARALSPATIAVLVIAALIILFLVYMLMRQ